MTPASSALLSIRDLSVRYGGVVALDGVSFDVPAGEIVGLIGPNGAGKTTLVDTLSGAVEPSAGEMLFDGQPITALPTHMRARRGLVRTYQSLELFEDLTVRENLLVASETVSIRKAVRDLFLPARPDPAALEAVEAALEVCGLQDVADQRPPDLSHGRRKLVGVARALAKRPKLILLDEPAAGLDSNETGALADQLARLPDSGMSVLLIDHDMSLVMSISSTVQVLDFGIIIASGSPAAVQSDPAVLAAYLGSTSSETL